MLGSSGAKYDLPSSVRVTRLGKFDNLSCQTPVSFQLFSWKSHILNRSPGLPNCFGGPNVQVRLGS